uniref:Peptidoglycan-recognition protein n=1 Tax=Strigamia maritima TaxID=126957 RepID=T1J7Z8_STRMM
MMILYLMVAFFAVDLSEQNTNCTGVTFVTRKEWNARPPKESYQYINESVPYAFIHHTAMTECNDFESCCAEMRIIQNFHMDDRGWDDIGYSFLVGGDGRVYIGRDWGVVGAHTYRYNTVGYGISFMGTFTNKLPNENAMEAVKKLIGCGVVQKYLQSDYGLYGHRDGRCTECPGDKFYEHLKTWYRWHAKGTITKYC